MHAFGHVVGRERAVERRRQRGAVQADVQIDRLGGLVQPVEVHVEEGDAAAMHPQPLPDAVARG